MELRHLRYFVVAAEEGHFGRAAERLHISGQGLGAQIRELEDELGFVLFERLPRGVRLTAAGTALLADARRVLDELQSAIKHAEGVSRGQVGILRVGHVPMITMRGTLSKIIPAFCTRYPKVDVRSMDLTTSEQYAALQEGRLDVAIVYTPPETAVGVHTEVIVEQALVGAMLPAAHPLAQKNPLYCRDLSVLPCLSSPAASNPTGRQLLIRELRARGLEVRFDEEHEISDIVVRVSLVAEGVGWMPAGDTDISNLLAGRKGVVFRRWVDPPISYQCCLAWRDDDSSPLVANFVASCRELRDGAAPSALSRPGVDAELDVKPDRASLRGNSSARQSLGS